MPKTSLAQRYIEAWNTHDPDKILSFFRKSSTYNDSGLNEQINGAELGKYIEKIIALCPDVHYELIDGGITGTGRAAIQWRATGQSLHRLCPMLNDEPIDSIGGLDYIVHDHGKLISTHVYFDLLPFTQQPSTTATSCSSKQYQKSGLTEPDMKFYQQQISKLMHDEKLYLKNELTLAELAEVMGLSCNHLSQVINGQFGLTFYELLNHFRIDHAKQLLQAIPADVKLSTLDIAYDSGFGSASAFYRAFQHQVKMTPIQYRSSLFEP